MLEKLLEFKFLERGLASELPLKNTRKASL